MTPFLKGVSNVLTMHSAKTVYAVLRIAVRHCPALTATSASGVVIMGKRHRHAMAEINVSVMRAAEIMATILRYVPYLAGTIYSAPTVIFAVTHVVQTTISASP